MVRKLDTPAVKHGDGCRAGLFLTLPDMMDGRWRRACLLRRLAPMCCD